MLKIGDFSKLGQVSVKTLRYYDEMELLQPIAVDRASGYRYYSVDQLHRLNRILALKDLGFSLEQIAQALEEGVTLEQMRGMFRLKQAEQQQHVREETERLQRVEARLRQIEWETTMTKYDVILKPLEAQQIASLREKLSSFAGIGKLHGEIFQFLGQKNIRPAGAPAALWHDHEYKETDIDAEAVVPVGETFAQSGNVRCATLPAIDRAACVIHTGAYEGFSQAYRALSSWIEANGYRIAGPFREVYLRGPGLEPIDPATYVTEIQVAVESPDSGK